MYQSARLLVRGPPATGRYRQNRPSIVDGGRKREEEEEKKKEEEKKYLGPSLPARHRRPRVAREPLPPAGDFSPARGERSRRRSIDHHKVSYSLQGQKH
ncbi:hypothetical protein BHM03_00005443 [Ensete ventricosum]|nr:hypothetical protein BHM03_00005443 [Ensete ventricosum]